MKGDLEIVDLQGNTITIGRRIVDEEGIRIVTSRSPDTVAVLARDDAERIRDWLTNYLGESEG